MVSISIDNAEKALQIVRGKTPQETISILSQALRSLNPSSKEKNKTLQLHLLRARASAYVSTKEFSRAKEDVKQINKLKPKDYVALEILARLYEHGDKKKAKTCYQAAIKSFQEEKGPKLDAKALGFTKHLEKRMDALTWVDPFQRLPAEVLLTIFEYVDFSQRARMMRVCKEWNQLLSSPVLWQHLDFSSSSLKQRKSVSIRSTMIRAIGRAKGNCKSLMTPSMDCEDLLLVLAFLTKYNASEIQTLDLRPSTWERSSAESMVLKLMQLSNLKKARLPYVGELCAAAASKSIALPSQLEELEWYMIPLGRIKVSFGYLPVGLAPATLSRLVVNHCGPGETIPQDLFALPEQEHPNLKYLALNGARLHENDFVKRKGIRYVWQPCLYTNLTTLKLSNCLWDCRELDAQGSIFVLPQTLAHFSLQNVTFFGDGGDGRDVMEHFAGDLTRLKSFRMTDCRESLPASSHLLEALNISNKPGGQLAEPSQTLGDLALDLFNTYHSMDTLIPILLDVLEDRCRYLQYLDLGLVEMDNGIVKFLIELCPDLEGLILRQLSKVSSAAIGALIRSLDRLKRLEFVDCPSLTDDAAELKAFGAKKGVTVVFTDQQQLNQGRPVRYGT